MKKLLFVFVLGAFAACGSGENATPTVDSAAIKDSIAKATAAMDSAAKAAVDTTAAKVDSAAKAH
jgi:flavin-binding protein dodecin